MFVIETIRVVSSLDRDANHLGDAGQYPVAVSNLADVLSIGGMKLSWSTNDQDLLGFNVYRIDPGDKTPQYLDGERSTPNTQGRRRMR